MSCSWRAAPAQARLEPTVEGRLRRGAPPDLADVDAAPFMSTRRRVVAGSFSAGHREQLVAPAAPRVRPRMQPATAAPHTAAGAVEQSHLRSRRANGCQRRAPLVLRVAIFLFRCAKPGRVSPRCAYEHLAFNLRSPCWPASKRTPGWGVVGGSVCVRSGGGGWGAVHGSAQSASFDPAALSGSRGRQAARTRCDQCARWFWWTSRPPPSTPRDLSGAPISHAPAFGARRVCPIVFGQP